MEIYKESRREEKVNVGKAERRSGDLQREIWRSARLSSCLCCWNETSALSDKKENV